MIPLSVITLSHCKSRRLNSDIVLSAIVLSAIPMSAMSAIEAILPLGSCDGRCVSDNCFLHQP